MVMSSIRRRGALVFVMAAAVLVGGIVTSAPAEASMHRSRVTFTASPEQPVAGQPVTFTDTTEGPHQVVLWVAFGGNPNHASTPTFTTTFPRPGPVLVLLVVRSQHDGREDMDGGRQNDQGEDHDGHDFEFALRVFFVKPAPQTTTVPNLQGDTTNQAATALAGAGLKLGHKTADVPSLLPAGTIVDTSPAAGATVPKGSAVDYRASTGAPAVTTVASGLANPSSLGVDTHGTIYVAIDGGVVDVIASGGGISSLPGGGTRVGVDQTDKVYANRVLDRTVVQVDPTTGNISFGSGYPGGFLGIPFSPNAAVNSGTSFDFSFDPGGNIVTALAGGDAARGTITTSVPGTTNILESFGHVAFGTTPGPTDINAPVSVAANPMGTTFVAQDNRIMKHVGSATTVVVGDPNGTAGNSGDGGSGANARLDMPTSIRFDGSGNLYIADAGNQRVRRWNPTTGVIENVVSGLAPDPPSGSTPDFTHPNVAFDHAGNLYVTDPGNGRILKAWVVPPSV
jgi:hypothetical protein